MDHQSANLWTVVMEGGVLMGPFLFLVLLWVVVGILYLGKGRKTLTWILGLFAFPIAFGLLAIANWASHQTTILYLSLMRKLHPEEIVSLGFVCTRSTLLICIVAGLSLLSSVLTMLLPNPRTETQKRLEQGHGAR